MVHPSILFVLGTEYDFNLIVQRWRHIEVELLKRNIKIISYGADGAGPFMVAESGIFKKQSENVPARLSIFTMCSLKDSCLSIQDIVRLLAKLKNKLLTPSNLVVIGREVACCSHLANVAETVAKSKYISR